MCRMESRKAWVRRMIIVIKRLTNILLAMIFTDHPHDVC